MSSALSLPCRFRHVHEVHDGKNHMVEVIVHLVFPKAEDNPPLLHVMACDIGISLDVATDFLAPKVAIGFREFEVDRAAMPIARVQEDDDA